jgi:hypothetical protein
LFWRQYEEPTAQRPFVHNPEQHSASPVQVLFAVVHCGFGETAAHFPALQFPVQQVLPDTGQVAPIVRHWVPPHLPPMQAPLQQSVSPAHAAVAGAHFAIDEAQVCACVSQIPEQQEEPEVQDPPNAVQVTLTLPSGPNPPSTFQFTGPSSPVAPSRFPPSSPGLPSETVASALPPELAPPSWPAPPSPVDPSSPRSTFPPFDPQPTAAIASAAKAHTPSRFIWGSLSFKSSGHTHRGMARTKLPTVIPFTARLAIIGSANAKAGESCVVQYGSRSTRS